jgi:hypothetical protein
VPNTHIMNNDTRCYKLQYMYKRGATTHYNVTKRLGQVDFLTCLPYSHDQPLVAIVGQLGHLFRLGRIFLPCFTLLSFKLVLLYALSFPPPSKYIGTFPFVQRVVPLGSSNGNESPWLHTSRLCVKAPYSPHIRMVHHSILILSSVSPLVRRLRQVYKPILVARSCHPCVEDLHRPYNNQALVIEELTTTPKNQMVCSFFGHGYYAFFF